MNRCQELYQLRILIVLVLRYVNFDAQNCVYLDIRFRDIDIEMLLILMTKDFVIFMMLECEDAITRNYFRTLMILLRCCQLRTDDRNAEL